MSAEDKLNELIPNVISFEAGERLSADKLNKLIRILNLNLEHIQGAVGDVYDVSGDATRNYWGKQFNTNASSTNAEKRRFDIANLARLIGPASNLNPQSLGSESIIKEEIPLDVLEYRLKYPKTGSINVGATYLNMGSKENLIEGRTYYIEDNVIYFSSKTVAEQVGDTSLEVIYTTNPTQYNGGSAYQGAGFNVYPDPNQVDEKLEVTYTPPGQDGGGSTYTISLPIISRQQGSLADRFETTGLDNRDINNNNQLKLPEWVQELDNGTVLPRYSLYLKNYDTNESYIDATYTKISDTSILVSGLEIGNQECINAFDLRLITVGTDITTSIDDLRNKMFLHKHDGSFGEPRINIKDIVGFYEAQVEGGSGPYYPSSSAGNPISNYLHRDGYKASSDEVNGDNAMRGPLMMGLTDFDPITSRVIVSDGDKYSYPLQFGSTLTYIQRVSEGEGSDNELKIKNTLGNIRLSSPSNSLVGQSNKYILTATEDSRFTVSADATLNVNEGLQVKQLTDMPHSVERINKGYKIEEMPYYKLMLKNPGQYTTPASTKGQDPQYVDIFDIHSTGNNSNTLGDVYHYEGNAAGVDGEERFERFYELENGSSDKGHFLNFVLRDGQEDNPDYIQYFWANKELNANLFFDLSRGNDFIISPLFEFDQDKDNYRPFEIHIFRGYSWNSTVGDQLNDASKKFTAEYQIQVDMDFLSTLNNNDWIGLFPSIILHYDYHSGPASNGHGIWNYEINADTGLLIEDAGPISFFEEQNIRRVEVPFNTRPDVAVTALAGGGNIETTELITNYSTDSLTSLKVKIGYDDGGIAKLSRFSINVKEEFWNGVFTVGIS